MTECTPIKLPSGEWKCTECGYIHDKPFRRNCGPKRPRRAKSGRATAKEQMSDRHAKVSQPDVSLATLIERVDACLGSRCKHLDRGVCNKGRARGCQRFENWFVRLMSPDGCRLQNSSQAGEDGTAEST